MTNPFVSTVKNQPNKNEPDPNQLQPEQNQTGSQASKKVVKVPLFLTVFLFLLMAFYAISVTMIGPIMPSVIENYQIRLSQGGLMTTFQSIGGILAVLAAGLLADRFKKTWLIFFSFLLFGLSLLLVSLVHVYAVLMLIFFVFGAGSRMSDTLINAYVSDLYQPRRGYYLNLLHTFFGIGALSGPIYVRFILAKGLSWSLIFSFLGIACVLLILFFPVVLKLAARRMQASDPHDLPAVYHRPSVKSGESSSANNTTQGNPLSHLSFIKNSPVIWLLCLIMILYLSHQATLSVWIPMYMETDLQVSPTFSGLSLSVLWLGIIMGRMISAHLTDKLSPARILIFGNLLAALVITLGILAQQPVLLMICLGITGFSNGATIPLLITVAADRYPEYTGASSSMIFLSGAFATMVFPWLAGRLAEQFGFQTAMGLAWVPLFIVFILSLLLNKAMVQKVD